MSWFNSTNVDSLHEVFLRKLKCLYDIELRLVEALPKMRDAATDPELRAGFNEHLGQTRQQVARLEEIFRTLDLAPERVTASAMKAMIAEGEDVISSSGDPAVRDAALIGCGQAVEHHEMALYGTARTWANTLGQQEIADLLQETLQEEGDTDKKLSMLAERSVNSHAAR